MGASQSQPSRRADEEPRRPTLRRRISTFLRRGDEERASASKRERSNSAQPLSSPGPKRRRVDDVAGEGRDASMAGSPSTAPVSAAATPQAGPSRIPSMARMPSSLPNLSHSSGVSTPTSPDTPASPATDELLSDRLRTMSTIRDTVGADLTPQPGPGLISRFTRRRDSPIPPATSSSSSSTANQPISSQPAAPPTPSRTLSHRLSAIMGFAAPERSSSGSSASSGSGATGSTARASSAQSTPTTESPSSDDDAGRIPVGAVLVIQGLAQTHANVDVDEAGGPPQVNLPSLDQQARMIGNLLTVAAAATATTLLSPERLAAQPSRSTAQSAMQNIIERLRPQRNRANQSVEAALGDYLRTVLRDNRRFAEAVAGDTPTGANVPAEFQDFLHTLQEDLIQAVRQYAVPEAAAAEENGSTHEEVEENASAEGSDTPAEADNDAADADSAATLTPGAIPSFHHQEGQNLPGASRGLGVTGGADGTPRRLNFFRAHLFPTVPADVNGAAASDSDAAEGIVPSIFVGVRSIAHSPNMTTEDLVSHPSFPFMDGQVPDESGEGGVDAAASPVSASSSTQAPVMTADLGEESRMSDGWVPIPPEYAGSGGEQAEVHGASASAHPARRSIRERVMDRLQRRAEAAAAQRAAPPLNTYLIYVIGGNYPRSHPVLSIPSLVSGGPLTAEDLQLLSELLGPAKPPTVTQEEIDASGLKVIPAPTLPHAVETGQVLDSSAERCMVCLCDYESDDECRVLGCRHAFHVACVDQWLTSGRNSCPSCRTEAVDKAALAPAVEDGDAV